MSLVAGIETRTYITKEEKKQKRLPIALSPASVDAELGV